MDEPLHIPLPDVLDLIQAPSRSKRPKRIVIVLRGPPGSGKSHIARKLRDAEVAAGGEAPRIHSIDDYFITVSGGQPDTLFWLLSMYTQRCMQCSNSSEHNARPARFMQAPSLMATTILSSVYI